MLPASAPRTGTVYQLLEASMTYPDPDPIRNPDDPWNRQWGSGSVITRGCWDRPWFKSRFPPRVCKAPASSGALFRLVAFSMVATNKVSSELSGQVNIFYLLRCTATSGLGQ